MRLWNFLAITVKPVYACPGFMLLMAKVLGNSLLQWLHSTFYALFSELFRILLFTNIPLHLLLIWKPTDRPNNQAATMHKRIARIIATNFCCWIPICADVYVRLGVRYSTIAYQISAARLLPINSAMNSLFSFNSSISWSICVITLMMNSLFSLFVRGV